MDLKKVNIWFFEFLEKEKLILNEKEQFKRINGVYTKDEVLFYLNELVGLENVKGYLYLKPYSIFKTGHLVFLFLKKEKNSSKNLKECLLKANEFPHIIMKISTETEFWKTISLLSNAMLFDTKETDVESLKAFCKLNIEAISLLKDEQK